MRTLLSSLALVVSSAVLTGCSGDAAEPPGPPDAIASQVGTTTADETTTAATAELATTAEIGRIVGRLPGERRKAVRKEVTQVIDGWWEAAYLAGTGSSADPRKAFPGFTEGARTRAKFDRQLMTRADLDAHAITPLMRKVRLDVLAVDRRARSVTARFDLRVRATGARSGRLQVRGRLFLTRRGDGWRVFGYDVSKGWL